MRLSLVQLRHHTGCRGDRTHPTAVVHAQDTVPWHPCNRLGPIHPPICDISTLASGTVAAERISEYRSVRALHTALRLAYEKVPPDARRARLAELLESWGFTKEQASLYASTVLCQNVESSADWAVTNGSRVLGSWVRGEQQGTEWLNTMKETWKFDINLTYEHKIETYEGYTTPSWTYVQSTYS